MKKLYTAFVFFLICTTPSIATTFYWGGGDGNWSDPNNWFTDATLSTNVGTVPNGVTDSVYFIDASFPSLTGADTVFLDISPSVAEMEWNTSNNPVFFSTNPGVILSVFNDLTFSSGMTVDIGSNRPIGMRGGSPAILTTNAVPIGARLDVNKSPGVSVTLADPLTFEGSISVRQGEFVSAGFAITTTELRTQTATTTKLLDLRGSQVNINPVSTAASIVIEGTSGTTSFLYDDATEIVYPNPNPFDVTIQINDDISTGFPIIRTSAANQAVSLISPAIPAYNLILEGFLLADGSSLEIDNNVAEGSRKAVRKLFAGNNVSVNSFGQACAFEDSIATGNGFFLTSNADSMIVRANAILGGNSGIYFNEYFEISDTLIAGDDFALVDVNLNGIGATISGDVIVQSGPALDSLYFLDPLAMTMGSSIASGENTLFETVDISSALGTISLGDNSNFLSHTGAVNTTLPSDFGKLVIGSNSNVDLNRRTRFADSVVVGIDTDFETGIANNDSVVFQDYLSLGGYSALTQVLFRGPYFFEEVRGGDNIWFRADLNTGIFNGRFELGLGTRFDINVGQFNNSFIVRGAAPIANALEFDDNLFVADSFVIGDGADLLIRQKFTIGGSVILDDEVEFRVNANTATGDANDSTIVGGNFIVGNVSNFFIEGSSRIGGDMIFGDSASVRISENNPSDFVLGGKFEAGIGPFSDDVRLFRNNTIGDSIIIGSNAYFQLNNIDTEITSVGASLVYQDNITNSDINGRLVIGEDFRMGDNGRIVCDRDAVIAGNFIAGDNSDMFFTNDNDNADSLFIGGDLKLGSASSGQDFRSYERLSVGDSIIIDSGYTFNTLSRTNVRESVVIGNGATIDFDSLIVDNGNVTVGDRTEFRLDFLADIAGDLVIGNGANLIYIGEGGITTEVTRIGGDFILGDNIQTRLEMDASAIIGGNFELGDNIGDVIQSKDLRVGGDFIVGENNNLLRFATNQDAGDSVVVAGKLIFGSNPNANDIDFRQPVVVQDSLVMGNGYNIDFFDDFLLNNSASVGDNVDLNGPIFVLSSGSNFTAGNGLIINATERFEFGGFFNAGDNAQINFLQGTPSGLASIAGDVTLGDNYDFDSYKDLIVNGNFLGGNNGTLRINLIDAQSDFTRINGNFTIGTGDPSENIDFGDSTFITGDFLAGGGYNLIRTDGYWQVDGNATFQDNTNAGLYVKPVIAGDLFVGNNSTLSLMNSSANSDTALVGGDMTLGDNVSLISYKNLLVSGDFSAGDNGDYLFNNQSGQSEFTRILGNAIFGTGDAAERLWFRDSILISGNLVAGGGYLEFRAENHFQIDGNATWLPNSTVNLYENVLQGGLWTIGQSSNFLVPDAGQPYISNGDLYIEDSARVELRGPATFSIGTTVTVDTGALFFYPNRTSIWGNITLNNGGNMTTQGSSGGIINTIQGDLTMLGNNELQLNYGGGSELFVQGRINADVGSNCSGDFIYIRPQAVNDATLRVASRDSVTGVTVDGNIRVAGDSLIVIEGVANGDPSVMGNIRFEDSSTTGKTFWWVGGTKTSADKFFSDNDRWENPSNWVTTASGDITTVNRCTPGPLDTVIFDANSFDAIGEEVFISADANPAVAAFYVTDDSDRPLFTGDNFNYPLTITGDFQVIADAEWDFRGNVEFSGTGIQNIRLENNSFFRDAVFNGTGTYNIQDSLITDNDIVLESGVLTTNDNFLSMENFNSNFPTIRTLDMGNSVMQIRDNGTALDIRNGATFTLNSGANSVWEFELPSTTDVYLDGNTRTFPNIIVPNANGRLRIHSGSGNQTANRHTFRKIRFNSNNGILYLNLDDTEFNINRTANEDQPRLTFLDSIIMSGNNFDLGVEGSRSTDPAQQDSLRDLYFGTDARLDYYGRVIINGDVEIEDTDGVVFTNNNSFEWWEDYNQVGDIRANGQVSISWKRECRVTGNITMGDEGELQFGEGSPGGDGVTIIDGNITIGDTYLVEAGRDFNLTGNLTVGNGQLGSSRIHLDGDVNIGGSFTAGNDFNIEFSRTQGDSAIIEGDFTLGNSDYVFFNNDITIYAFENVRIGGNFTAGNGVRFDVDRDFKIGGNITFGNNWLFDPDFVVDINGSVTAGNSGGLVLSNGSNGDELDNSIFADITGDVIVGDNAWVFGDNEVFIGGDFIMGDGFSERSNFGTNTSPDMEFDESLTVRGDMLIGNDKNRIEILDSLFVGGDLSFGDNVRVGQDIGFTFRPIDTARIFGNFTVGSNSNIVFRSPLFISGRTTLANNASLGTENPAVFFGTFEAGDGFNLNFLLSSEFRDSLILGDNSNGISILHNNQNGDTTKYFGPVIIGNTSRVNFRTSHHYFYDQFVVGDNSGLIFNETNQAPSNASATFANDFFSGASNNLSVSGRFTFENLSDSLVVGQGSDLDVSGNTGVLQFPNLRLAAGAEFTHFNTSTADTLFINNLLIGAASILSLNPQDQSPTVILDDIEAVYPCSSPVVLRSSFTGNQADLFVNGNSGNILANGWVVRDINVVSAFNDSIIIGEGNNQGNNSGNLRFLTERIGTIFYWIGGSASNPKIGGVDDNTNWSNPLNWSFTSGGAPSGGGCVPTLGDTVIFDSLGFTNFARRDVSIDPATGSPIISDFIWAQNIAAATFDSLFRSDTSKAIRIGGNFSFTGNNVNNYFAGEFLLEGTPAAGDTLEFRSNGARYVGPITFNSPVGRWIIYDDIDIDNPDLSRKRNHLTFSDGDAFSLADTFFLEADLITRVGWRREAPYDSTTVVFNAPDYDNNFDDIQYLNIQNGGVWNAPFYSIVIDRLGGADDDSEEQRVQPRNANSPSILRDFIIRDGQYDDEGRQLTFAGTPGQGQFRIEDGASFNIGFSSRTTVFPDTSQLANGWLPSQISLDTNARVYYSGALTQPVSGAITYGNLYLRFGEGPANDERTRQKFPTDTIRVINNLDFDDAVWRDSTNPFPIIGVPGNRLTVDNNAQIYLGSATVATEFPSGFSTIDFEDDFGADIVYEAGVTQMVRGIYNPALNNDGNYPRVVLRNPGVPGYVEKILDGPLGWRHDFVIENNVILQDSGHQMYDQSSNNATNRQFIMQGNAWLKIGSHTNATEFPFYRDNQTSTNARGVDIAETAIVEYQSPLPQMVWTMNNSAVDEDVYPNLILSNLNSDGSTGKALKILSTSNRADGSPNRGDNIRIRGKFKMNPYTEFVLGNRRFNPGSGTELDSFVMLDSTKLTIGTANNWRPFVEHSNYSVFDLASSSEVVYPYTGSGTVDEIVGLGAGNKGYGILTLADNGNATRTEKDFLANVRIQRGLNIGENILLRDDGNQIRMTDSAYVNMDGTSSFVLGTGASAASATTFPTEVPADSVSLATGSRVRYRAQGTTAFNQLVRGLSYSTLSLERETGGPDTTRKVVTGDSLFIRDSLIINNGTALLDSGYQVVGTPTAVLNQNTNAGLFLGNGAQSTQFPLNFVQSNINLAPQTEVVYDGGPDQLVSAVPSYRRLRLSNTESAGTGVKELTGTTTIREQIAIDNGATLDHSLGNNYGINVFGSWYCDGCTHEPRLSTVTFRGDSLSNLDADGESFYDLLIEKSGLVDTVRLRGSLGLGHSLTLVRGRFHDYGHQVEFTGTPGSGGLTILSPGQFYLGRNDSATVFPDNSQLANGYPSGSVILDPNSRVAYNAHLATQDMSTAVTYGDLYVVGGKDADVNIYRQPSSGDTLRLRGDFVIDGSRYSDFQTGGQLLTDGIGPDLDTAYILNGSEMYLGNATTATQFPLGFTTMTTDNSAGNTVYYDAGVEQVVKGWRGGLNSLESYDAVEIRNPYNAGTVVRKSMDNELGYKRGLGIDSDAYLDDNGFQIHADQAGGVNTLRISNGGFLGLGSSSTATRFPLFNGGALSDPMINLSTNSTVEYKSAQNQSVWQLLDGGPNDNNYFNLLLTNVDSSTTTTRSIKTLENRGEADTDIDIQEDFLIGCYVEFDPGTYQISYAGGNDSMVMEDSSRVFIGAAGANATFPAYTNANVDLASSSEVVYRYEGGDQAIRGFGSGNNGYGFLTLQDKGAGTVTKTLSDTTRIQRSLYVGSFNRLVDDGHQIYMTDSSRVIAVADGDMLLGSATNPSQFPLGVLSDSISLDSTDSRVTYIGNGGTVAPVRGDIVYGDLRFTKIGTAAGRPFRFLQDGPIYIGDDLTLDANTVFLDSGFQIAVNPTQEINLDDNTELRIGSSTVATKFPLGPLTGTIDFSTPNITVVYEAGPTQEVSTRPNYRNLQLVNGGGTGIKVIDSGNVNVRNNLIVDAGATLDHNDTADFNITVEGDYLNSGNLLARRSTTTLAGGNSNLLLANDEFYNLAIDKGAAANAVTLTSSVKVSNQVTFGRGDFISTDANRFVFDTNATHTGATNISYIRGPVYKVAETGTDFDFPVGYPSEDTIRLAGIFNVVATDTTLFRGEYNRVSPTVDGFDKNTIDPASPEFMVHVSDVEYWDIDNAGSNLTSANVRLTYDDVASRGVNECVTLRVAHWNGSAWEARGSQTVGGGACSNASGVVESTVGYTSFSPFTLGSLWFTNPLPVTLQHFTAKAISKEQVSLDWLTVDETEILSYVVERSLDQENWSDIGEVEARNTGSTQGRYNVMDNDPYTGLSYYRLRIEEADGTVQYSKIEAIDLGSSTDDEVSLLVYPNPMTGSELNLTLTGATFDQFVVSLMSGLGKEVATFEIAQPAYEVQLEVNGLEAGMYYLQLISKDGSTRLVKPIVVE